MSKRYNIRWTEDDSKELARTAKNFNAKVARLEKKYAGTDVILPEKVSVKELRELIGTRNDLKREINSLQRFTKRGAEEIVKAPVVEEPLYITKWQRTEMNRRAATTNNLRSKRYEMTVNLPMSSRGKPLGYTVGDIGMGKAEELSLNPIETFTPKMSKYDLKAKFRALRKHSQSDYFDKADRRLRENYTNALKETYGEENVKEILEAIEKMSFSKFYKTFKSEPGAFEFASDIPDDADIEAYLEGIKATWIPEEKPDEG
jgi:hypothetical protein